jgi:hypothetical protein
LLMRGLTRPCMARSSVSPRAGVKRSQGRPRAEY